MEVILYAHAGPGKTPLGFWNTSTSFTGDPREATVVTSQRMLDSLSEIVLADARYAGKLCCGGHEAKVFALQRELIMKT